MITRAVDAKFINEVLNHPAVRPHVHAPAGIRLDMTQVVSNPNHVVLTGEHGGMIFIQHVKGVYEIHTQVLPDGRGAWALQMAQECVDWLFSKTNAIEVFTRVPEGNVAAMALTRACGAKPEETVWQELSGVMSKVTIFSGRIQDWIRIAPQLPARGQLFHVKLAEKYKAMNLNLAVHDEDPWHDRHVGAAVGMFLGGQPVKGMMVFNRYAAMSMAPPMKILSLDPLVVDITDCRLEIIGDDFEVITCQPE